MKSQRHKATKKNFYKQADIYAVKSHGTVVIFNNSSDSVPNWYATPLKAYCDIKKRYENAICKGMDTKAELLEWLGE